MSVINAIPLLAAAGGDYQISRSVRLRSSASAYFNRTPASAGSLTTWTLSAWAKRGALTSGGNFTLFSAGSAAQPYTLISFTSDQLAFDCINAGSVVVGRRYTNQVFRDPSAWYHLVFVWDTTNATAGSRMRMYVNGVQVTSFSLSSDPALNATTQANTTAVHYFGEYPAGGNYFDGYLTEVNFIDGQALTPSSFGETDAVTGVWKPKKYTGTYGTNGFYLNFSDNSAATAAAIGKDSSGNGNNWTPNNISLTSGSTYDSMTDVPTLTSATTANYCVLNPLVPVYANSISYANMRFSNSQAATWATANSTLGVSSGKWYWEATITTLGGAAIIGISNSDTIHGSTALGQLSNDYAYLWNGNKQGNAGSATSYGATYTTGNVIGVALDMDAGTLTFYKDNSSQGTAFTGLSNSSFVPAVSNFNSGVIDINFGQRPFTYTPPTGFVALNTFNLPTPTIGATASTTANKYFDVLTYTGNATTNNITSLGFQPDFSWFKIRSETGSNIVHDVLRGTGGVNRLFTNTTSAESTNGDGFVTFTSNGFNLDGGGGGGDVNGMTSGVGRTYVAWNWKANGSGVTNTAGSITSTVSANTTAGFSIVTYTGTGSVATIGHGLGVKPSMIFFKVRSNGTYGWYVYNSVINATNHLVLNTTAASSSSSFLFNDTEPTSSVMTVGTSAGTNQSGQTYVAYCFAPIAGYSAFGSYTGNGSSDGVFVYTGFKPKFLLIKRSDSAADWYLYDSARGSYNENKSSLYPNSSDAEGSSLAGHDFLSNGFKVRTSINSQNTNGGTYIYMAFAEFPQKFALGV